MNNVDDDSFSICSGGNFSNYLNNLVPNVVQFLKKMSVKKVIFVEKLATHCRPRPVALLKADFFKVASFFHFLRASPYGCFWK